jgi:hypothetical protein
MDSWRPGNSKRIGRQRSLGRRLPQLSDVENEVNGVLTYNRTTVQKVNPEAVRKLCAPSRGRSL